MIQNRFSKTISSHVKLHKIFLCNPFYCNEKKCVCTHFRRENDVSKEESILDIVKSRQIGLDKKEIGVETLCKETVGALAEGSDETSE